MLETVGDTFWVLVEEGNDSLILFSDKNSAIVKLTEYDNPNSCQIISLSRKDAEWAIEQVSWQEIASALIKKVKG